MAELTGLVYGCLFGKSSWQAFLDRLAETLPGGKTALHYHDVTSPVAHLPYTSGFSDAEIDQFSKHFALVNPWLPGNMQAPVGQGVTGEDLVPRDQLIRTEFYNDWLKRQAGCETAVGITMIREPTHTLFLVTCTSSLDVAVNRRAADLYTALSPHLKRMVDLLRKAHITLEPGQAGQTLLDAIGVGLIYVSENRVVRSLNGSAERMLASGAPLRLAADGRLGFQLPQTAEKLDQLASRHGVHSEPHVSMIKGSDDVLYRLTLIRMTSDLFLELLNGPTVAIIVEPMTTERPDVRQERLMETFKLTPKEARIASGLLAGLSPKDMALADGVSYETIRTHLKSIYAKLHVNSQAALVAMLMR
ncbi:DNA-binding CsgD family transcriptional regulator [Mycoplana sp. BE70]|uniref:helix-turn-helix transcriptional regulator n=1 Tax=Mycoplana sp. BE70 TaxID=2817775 RepID=UPI00285B64C9|nr:helix-turn-helix transcriptional regulator [Mycoplana sp. BE70]MDR6754781.1 DNA-binding CsgD family transcriptional regulator [Mycoplana sp. BE70]